MRILLAIVLLFTGLTTACQPPARTEGPPGHQGQYDAAGHWRCLHGNHGAEGHDYVNCNHCSHGPH